MKNYFYVLCFLFARLISNAQNLDSLFYDGMDTTGLAAEIAKEEADWRWTDTVRYTDFSELDNHAFYFDKRYKNIPDLAKKLTEGIQNEQDKIRVIFSWVALYVAYDYDELHSKTKSKIYCPNFSKKTSKAKKAKAWEDVYLKYAQSVLKKRRGVCEGYATLFYELCRYSGVGVQMVHGKASNSLDDTKKTYGGHAWNKVRLGDEWYYVDVTWASGNSYEKGKFDYSYSINNFYFLTHIDKLFETHIVNEKKTKRRNELVGNY